MTEKFIKNFQGNFKLTDIISPDNGESKTFATMQK